MNEILAPLSPGELLDKITILRIKVARISEAAKLVNVQRELAVLLRTWQQAVPDSSAIVADEQALEAVNARLWDIEDRIRDEEAAQRFGARFVELARAVYVENDERARIKKRINEALGSTLVECIRPRSSHTWPSPSARSASTRADENSTNSSPAWGNTTAGRAG
jgi:tetrahydromethanopterin S-methyltransferase subunit G